MKKTNQFTRSIDGILLFDKPEGMSSNAALQIVKKLYCAKKAGHTGSLDPLASGMLPICLGESTKFSQYLLDADKHYSVTAQLGIKTTTGDCEGKVIRQNTVPVLSENDIKQLFTDFTGAMEQVPSMYSALKHNGQPLYKLARQGIEIERPPRKIMIYHLIFKKFVDDCLSFEVTCSKGTYIRTLVEDLGETLQCGAHVSKLRRSYVGNFNCQPTYSLSRLQEAKESGSFTLLDSFLLPIDSSITGWPELRVSEAAVYYLKHGQAIIAPTAPDSVKWVRLIRQNNQFLGIGEILSNGWVAPRRLIATS